jgi:putative transposase
MKLNNTKVLELLRKKNNGLSSYKTRKAFGISERRVNQLWREYCLNGVVPRLKRPGRPSKPLEAWEVSLVKEAYKKYGASASILEKLIMRDYNQHIPHNRVHKILLQEGLANKGDYVKRKKDWIRYERRHSLTAVHVDWHQRPNDGCWVFAVEDDASRALLTLFECNSPTTEASIDGLKTALKYGQIRECISDHGCQFTSNNEGKSQFKEFLDSKGIKQILCRIKHPQSNGKIEKFFHLYENHRDKFDSADQFKHWYNQVRPHLSLDFSRLETPWKAFQRKTRD